MACDCEVCTHAPTTLRVKRCQRQLPRAERPDLHTAAYVAWQPTVLPPRPPPQAPEEPYVARPPPQLKRIGGELPWMALFAVVALLCSMLRSG